MPEVINTADPFVPRVSVIIVTYNQASELRRAIQALERSTNRAEIEIVVIDCASTDGTRSLDIEFPKVNMLRLPHHIGAARALNIATRTAKAELALYLSPSVEVLPDTIAKLADALDADPDIIAACALLTNESGEPTPRVYQMPKPAAMSAGGLTPAPVDLSEPSRIECPSLDALMIRKQFVIAMNYFDERYGHYWVDAELAMQAFRAAKKMRLYPAARAVYHPGPDPLAGDSLAIADRITGAAEFASKYGGSGMSMRISAALTALVRMQIGLFFALAGGQKLDGGQV